MQQTINISAFNTLVR